MLSAPYYVSLIFQYATGVIRKRNKRFENADLGVQGAKRGLAPALGGWKEPSAGHGHGREEPALRSETCASRPTVWPASELGMLETSGMHHGQAAATAVLMGRLGGREVAGCWQFCNVAEKNMVRIL